MDPDPKQPIQPMAELGNKRLSSKDWRSIILIFPILSIAIPAVVALCVGLIILAILFLYPVVENIETRNYPVVYQADDPNLEITDGAAFNIPQNIFDRNLFFRLSPAGNRLAYMNEAGRLVSLDLNLNKEVVLSEYIIAPGRGIANVQWSPDGNKIAFSRGMSMFYRDFNSDIDKPWYHFDCPEGRDPELCKTGVTMANDFWIDNNTLAMAGLNNQVQIYDLASGKTAERGITKEEKDIRKYGSSYDNQDDIGIEYNDPVYLELKKTEEFEELQRCSVPLVENPNMKIWTCGLGFKSVGFETADLYDAILYFEDGKSTPKVLYKILTSNGVIEKFGWNNQDLIFIVYNINEERNGFQIKKLQYKK